MSIGVYVSLRRIGESEVYSQRSSVQLHVSGKGSQQQEEAFKSQYRWRISIGIFYRGSKINGLG
jgi:hypothetical protein